MSVVSEPIAWATPPMERVTWVLGEKPVPVMDMVTPVWPQGDGEQEGPDGTVMLSVGVGVAPSELMVKALWATTAFPVLTTMNPLPVAPATVITTDAGMAPDDVATNWKAESEQALGEADVSKQNVYTADEA